MVSLLASACSGRSGPLDDCQQPPAEQLALESDAIVTLDPNPVAAGATAILTISEVGLPEGETTHYGSRWSCWNGATWINTHRLWPGERTDLVRPGVITTSPPIAYVLPAEATVRIPDVAPGVYRIDHTGFVYVEVIAPD